MARVELHSARTSERDPVRAAEALVSQLGGATPKLVNLFHSRDRDAGALNRALRERLPKSCRLVGATTAGEIDRDGIHEGTAVIGALSGDFEVGLGLGAGLSVDAVGAGNRAIERAAAELGTRPADLDPRKYVAMVIDDGFRYRKEELLLGVLERNQALIVVGGGAADHEGDPEKQSALLHLDGEVVTDAVITTLVRTDAPWAALRSHWYEPTGQMIRVTKTDATCKRVLEIDGKPAAARYAELLDVPVEELEFGSPTGFGVRPTAMKVGREYFMRAPWKPLPDGSILFANLMHEDTELELMRLGDMVGLTRRFFEQELPARVPNPQAAIHFHCSGRMWMAGAMGQVGALSEAFRAAPPSAGFNCHFELYSGFHINTTLTMLAFGSNE
ncbi:FIST signal transduction protein [Vulgatibacter sp.]|uniref:FIST signal transduction protein n=1 Tax=Vulgatibacter sp. TaxID=1971226 RepID=UPI00356A0890